MPSRVLLLFKTRELPHEFCRNRVGIEAASFANPIEFNEVEPALSKLDPAHKGSLALQLLGKLALGQFRVRPHFDKLFPKRIVEWRKDGFFHARDLRAKGACTQNAGSIKLNNA